MSAKSHSKSDDSIMNKSTTSSTKTPIQFELEGYAFCDNIIGVTHSVYTEDEETNIKLQHLIHREELKHIGFSEFVVFRDTTSGKADKPLRNDKNRERILFLSINVHHFRNAEEAHRAVLIQCQKLLSVRPYFFLLVLTYFASLLTNILFS